MENRTIKISESNYKEICQYAGGLQLKLGEPVSIDRALTFLLKKRKISDLAGKWNMPDREAEELLANLRGKRQKSRADSFSFRRAGATD